jgi:hypothetical protein
MPESFGVRLRRHREEQRVDLATIAEQTKISIFLLQSLERDDVSHWPSGIFRRAFIRAYAQAIGLDPDTVLREFLEAHPEPAEVAVAALANAAAADSALLGGGPPTRLRCLVESAIDSFSRFRRSAALDDAVVSDGAQVSAPVEPELHPAPPASPEPRAASPEPRPASPEPRLAFAVPSPASAEPSPASAEPRPEPKEVGEAVPGSVAPRDVQGASRADLLAVAELCTKLSQVENSREVQPLLREAVRILNAKGLIVWVWDAAAAVLTPALASGYSRSVLARLPAVRRDSDNPTAAAFRSAEPCAIGGGEHASGALAVPLVTAAGCAGVLAIELQQGGDDTSSACAIAMILGAILAQLIGPPGPAEVSPRSANAGEDLLGCRDASV